MNAVYQCLWCFANVCIEGKGERAKTSRLSNTGTVIVDCTNTRLWSMFPAITYPLIIKHSLAFTRTYIVANCKQPNRNKSDCENSLWISISHCKIRKRNSQSKKKLRQITNLQVGGTCCAWERCFLEFAAACSWVPCCAFSCIDSMPSTDVKHPQNYASCAHVGHLGQGLYRSDGGLGVACGGLWCQILSISNNFSQSNFETANSGAQMVRQKYSCELQEDRMFKSAPFTSCGKISLIPWNKIKTCWPPRGCKL